MRFSMRSDEYAPTKLRIPARLRNVGILSIQYAILPSYYQLGREGRVSWQRGGTGCAGGITGGMQCASKVLDLMLIYQAMWPLLPRYRIAGGTHRIPGAYCEALRSECTHHTLNLILLSIDLLHVL